jgi:hypothetical protein
MFVYNQQSPSPGTYAAPTQPSWLARSRHAENEPKGLKENPEPKLYLSQYVLKTTPFGAV